MHAQELLCFFFDRSTLIVGGGAFNGLGVKEASAVPAEVRVAWGIGQTWRLGTATKALNERAIRKVYNAATTRDPQFASSDVPLLPCVSVLHPLVDLAPGMKGGLFLNQDEAASGSSVDEVLRRYAATDPNLVTASNAMDAERFAALFAETETITTNSYHAAYWSLLSGRGVRLVGYSTKFLNLLSLFDLPASSLVPYERGNGTALAEAIAKAIGAPAVYAKSAQSTKERFRDMNLSFARSLAEHGIMAAPKPKVQQ